MNKKLLATHFLMLVCLVLLSGVSLKSVAKNDSEICLSNDFKNQDFCEKNISNPLNMKLNQAVSLQKQGKYKLSNSLIRNIEENNDIFDNLDSEKIHLLLRTKGKNHFYMHNLSTAKFVFDQALQFAKSRNNLELMSKSYNDLGIVLKAKQEYLSSLQFYKNSLDIKEKLDNKIEIANTLYNIGNLYIVLEDYELALNTHYRALDIYSQLLKSDVTLLSTVVHIKNQIAVSLEKTKGLESGILQLEKLVKEQENNPNKDILLFDIYIDLANYYLKNNNLNKAKRILENTNHITDITTNQQLAKYLVISDLLLRDNNPKDAELILLKGLNVSTAQKYPEKRLLFFCKLVNFYEQEKDSKKALKFQKKLTELSLNQFEEKHNIEVKKLQNEIELHFQDKQITVLKNNAIIKDLLIKKNRLQTYFFLLFSFFLILLVILQYKKRKNEKKYLLNEINFHKQELLNLSTPIKSITTTFSSFETAILTLSSTGVVKYYNEAFEKAIKIQGEDLLGRGVDNNNVILAIWNKIQFKEDDTACEQKIILDIENEKRLYISVKVLNSLSNLIVLSIETSNENNKLNLLSTFIDNLQSIETVKVKINVLCDKEKIMESSYCLQKISRLLENIQSKEFLNESYRSSLVALMSKNLEVWRQTTLDNKVGLAQKSQLWKVTVDDGRLRTRALDRYLNINSLPKVPRWRSVIKTSHYILSECDLSDANRTILKNQLEDFMEKLRNQQQMT